MATKKGKSAGPIYVMKSKVFRSVRLDIPPRIRKNIPWVVTTDTTVGDTIKRLREVPLGTLFAIDNEAKLVGVITTSPEAASKNCGGGGGGGTPNPNSSSKNCQADCDSACADRGGCAFIIYDPFGGSTKCSWECNDQFAGQQGSMIGDVWF